MKDSNRSFLKFLKPSKNGHSPNGVGPLPSDWPSFKTSIEKRKLLVGVETDESELRQHRVNLSLWILVVVTTLGGEIVVLSTNPKFFILNGLALPGLVAYMGRRKKKMPPNEHGGGP